MATIGNSSKPTTSQVWTGLNNQNQVALRVTMPTSGTITHVGAWFAGRDSGVTARVCVWNASGTLVAQSAQFTAGGKPFGVGQSTNEYHALTSPYDANDGQVLYIGFSRNPSSSTGAQWGLNSSGTHYRDTFTGSWPGNASFGSNSGSMGAYATYETNKPPTAPSLISPNSSETLSSTTPNLVFDHNDPNNDPIVNYDLQVSTDSEFGSVTHWDVTNGTSGVSNRRVTRTYAGTGLTRGTWYYWRARTNDGTGDGPWSGSRRFRVNRLPTATKVSPATNDLAFIHNLGTDTTLWTSGGAHAKARFTWTFADADGHGQGKYRVRIYSASTGGTVVSDSGIVSSASTTHNDATPLVMGTSYWWTIEVWDALGDSSGESSRTAFKVRWGQVIYEHAVSGGTSSTEWAFSSGAVAANTQSGFIFATATGANGAGRSSWKQNIGALAPNAYLNVMARLATNATGTNPTLPWMKFTYLASGVQPQKWQFAGGGAGSFLLDEDVRRYGSRSMRVTATTGSSGSTPGTATYIDRASVASATDVQSFVASLPARQAGDFLLMILTFDGQGDTAQDTNTPSGWTRIRRDMISNGDGGAILFYRIATGTESAPTLTFTGGITSYYCTIANYRHDAGHTFTVVANGVTNDLNESTTHTSPTLSTTSADDKYIAIFHKTKSNSFSGYSGALTERFDLYLSNAFAGHALADETMTGTGASGTRTATSSVSQRRLVHAVLLRPDDITQSTSTDHYAFVPDLSVTGLTDYTASVYVKTDGALTGGSVRLQILRNGTSDVIAQSASTTDTSAYRDGWQRLKVSFTTTSDTDAVEFRILFASPVQGQKFWTDAAMLEEGVIASAWKPGTVGEAAVADVSGFMVDATKGGVFLLRSSTGVTAELDPIARGAVPSVLRAERITSNQSITSATDTTIIFNSVIREDDEEGNFSMNTSTGELTIARAGWYQFEAGVSFAASAAGQRTLKVARTTGGAYDIARLRLDPAAAGQSAMNVTGRFYCAANDVIVAVATQDSGGAINVVANTSTFFTVQRIR